MFECWFRDLLFFFSSTIVLLGVVIGTLVWTAFQGRRGYWLSLPGLAPAAAVMIGLAQGVLGLRAAGWLLLLGALLHGLVTAVLVVQAAHGRSSEVRDHAAEDSRETSPPAMWADLDESGDTLRQPELEVQVKRY